MGHHNQKTGGIIQLLARALALCFLAMALGQAPAHAVDKEGPRLLSFESSPSTIDTSSENRTVTLKGSFSDATGSWYMAFTCGNVMRFGVDPDRREFVDYVYIRGVGLPYLLAFKQTSGDSKNFTFELEVPLNQNMAPENCTWTYRAKDDAGNESSGTTGKTLSVTSRGAVVASTPAPGPVSPRTIKYKNCAALQKVYAGGVALSSKSVNKGGKIKLKPTVNAKVYNLNKSLDRDKDGLACER